MFSLVDEITLSTPCIVTAPLYVSLALSAWCAVQLLEPASSGTFSLTLESVQCIVVGLASPFTAASLMTGHIPARPRLPFSSFRPRSVPSAPFLPSFLPSFLPGFVPPHTAQLTPNLLPIRGLAYTPPKTNKRQHFKPSPRRTRHVAPAHTPTSRRDHTHAQ